MRKEHRWRTLIRVTSLSTDFVWCVAPAWNNEVSFPVARMCFRDFEQPVIVGTRFHAVMALNADEIGDLNITDFEESPNGNKIYK